MIKVGNVWYPKSQTKLAKQMLIWRHRAWLTEMRKIRDYGPRNYRRIHSRC
jgi:hypothetical protein